jgi:8-oxo-dGTP diphosphatase
MPHTYDYPHPAVTVDIVVVTIHDNALKVLLIRRAQEPYAGMWALPGGFVEIDESLRRAAWRELREETGVSASFLEQLGAFGHPDRDPRERVITVVYYALVPHERLRVRAGSDAAEARLFSFEELPELAFDHAKILRRTQGRLRDKIEDPVIALQLVPKAFTLTELQRAHEFLLGRELDKRNFRKKLLALDVIEATGETKRSGPYRPARLYRARDPADVPYRPGGK